LVKIFVENQVILFYNYNKVYHFCSKCKEANNLFYKAELKLLEESFKKCHIRTLVLPKTELLSIINPSISNIESNTIYRFKDNQKCSYILFALPRSKNDEIMLIGPYLSKEITQNEIFEIAENNGLPPQSFAEFENYYISLPIIPQNSHIFVMLDSFAEIIWQNSYIVTDLESDATSFDEYNQTIELGEQNAAWNIQIMEERYKYENEMMLAVQNGQVHKVEVLLSGISNQNFEQRLSDPIRNLKNYCIIMNTLLRKSAQNGGVHPVHLDRISSDFAAKIEMLSTVSAVKNLMSEMFRSYCLLVQKNSVKKYSPTIQKIITHIDIDLSSNPTLASLAKAHNINASYLSSLFKKETGKNITEYINLKRISTAKRLLKTTNLQIQTIAQYCGILDIRYFSKLFKKHCGISPSEYRNKS
jgi:AraC-like DNA-binding protein